MASERARQLRRNSTDAEGRLWNAPRSRQLANYKFRRQRPIGPFIADFVCIAHKLDAQITQREYAARRDALLAKLPDAVVVVLGGREPAEDTVLRDGDIVVIYGQPDELERAEAVLLAG